MAVPTEDKVDFRAACFCHKTIVDVGFICSVCLSSKCPLLVQIYRRYTSGQFSASRPQCVPPAGKIDQVTCSTINSWTQSKILHENVKSTKRCLQTFSSSWNSRTTYGSGFASTLTQRKATPFETAPKHASRYVSSRNGFWVIETWSTSETDDAFTPRRTANELVKVDANGSPNLQRRS